MFHRFHPRARTIVLTALISLSSLISQAQAEMNSMKKSIGAYLSIARGLAKANAGEVVVTDQLREAASNLVDSCKDDIIYWTSKGGSAKEIKYNFNKASQSIAIVHGLAATFKDRSLSKTARNLYKEYELERHDQDLFDAMEFFREVKLAEYMQPKAFEDHQLHLAGHGWFINSNERASITTQQPVDENGKRRTVSDKEIKTSVKVQYGNVDIEMQRAIFRHARKLIFPFRTTEPLGTL